MASKTATPTNHELARLLEAIMRELAEIRRDQQQLAHALARLHSPDP